MIKLSDYLDPVSIERPLWGHLSEPSCLSHNLTISTASNPVTSVSGYKLAVIGIPDDRRSPNKGSSKAPDSIRESLYQLARIPGKLKIADLGNIKIGPNFEDTLAAIRDLLQHLSDEGCPALMIGGSSAVIPAIHEVVGAGKSPYNWAAVDSRIDFVAERREPDSFNYLGSILHDRKNRLGNFTAIGYQTYLNDPQTVNRFRKMNHKLVRIGEARSDLLEIEPIFRDSSLITFDISAVRQSDAPGTFAPSPNGFYTEEICLLARYAGLSDRMKVFGLFEVNPLLDTRNQTSSLASQLLWFLLEGIGQKQNEADLLGQKETNGRFIKYHVSVEDLEEDLLFIRSSVTNRWWLSLVTNGGKKRFVACSYRDYLKAGEGEIPQRWMDAISHKGE